MSAPPPAAVATLPARAVQAMQDGRFKEAIDLFKQLMRVDPRPEWRDSLCDAYAGRARGLAAKGMVKEAALVLENTLSPAKLLREPALYAACLIRDSQQAKAATYLLHCAGQGALPASLEELAAALLLGLPQLPPAPVPLTADATRWRDLATAARGALAAWIDGAPDEVVEQHLARISLRSAFRPLRLLLKTLITRPIDPARTRTLLESIAPGSPFFPLRAAVEAALCGGAALDADAWARLSAAQQAFVAESGGLTAAAAHAIGRLADAASSGPGGLFTWLLKQTDLPRGDLRSACFNLLPQLPDRLAQFEKVFGTLAEPERIRLRALSAEGRGQWRAAESAWKDLAQHYREVDDPPARMAAGVICRHLAQMCREHPELEGGRTGEDPRFWYLERSREVDPDHLPTVLALLAHYRGEAEDAKWHELTDEAVSRFGEDSQVLLAAMESAVAREAYKKATGFARRLLKLDPINMAVRRQMIELHVAHARKQIRGKRADLAAKELALAAEWDRPDAPSAVLRMARGLLSLRGGDTKTATALLHEAAELGGGGVGGWFRIVLEAELLKCTRAESAVPRRELEQARERLPSRPAVLAVANALGQPEAVRNKPVLRSLLTGMHAWLEQGAAIDWTQDEFLIIADSFTRFEAYDLLHDYATAARKREPDNPEWRFQEIVGRTRGKQMFMSVEESDEMEDLIHAAIERRDFHAHGRMMKFLDPERKFRMRNARVANDFDDDDYDDDELIDELSGVDPQLLYNMFLKIMPKDVIESLRERLAGRNRDAAIEIALLDLSESPIGGAMPAPMLRTLAEAVVDKVMGGPGSGRRKRRA
jgi:hypothetical protein